MGKRFHQGKKGAEIKVIRKKLVASGSVAVGKRLSLA
jgi:hypothetical protein